MNFIKKNIGIIIFSILLLANTPQCLALNLGDAFGNKNLKEPATVDMGYNTNVDADILIGTIIQAFLSILGVIFLVLMLYGGYLWMTDRGTEKSVEKAKSVIQASIIGLAIVLVSYSISYFIISKLGSATLK